LPRYDVQCKQQTIPPEQITVMNPHDKPVTTQRNIGFRGNPSASQSF